MQKLKFCILKKYQKRPNEYAGEIGWAEVESG